MGKRPGNPPTRSLFDATCDFVIEVGLAILAAKVQAPKLQAKPAPRRQDVIDIELTEVRR